jgi:hypothetical protein
VKIISHRGFWLHPSEKNTLVAFERALSSGFGIETDFRDHGGHLVIAHDLPSDNVIYADDLSNLLSKFNCDSLMALNIKADGLQNLMQDFIISSQLDNYFVFDMAVPDMRLYLNKKIKAYTRLSEYELTPCFLETSVGVWLDSFESNIWYEPHDIQSLVNKDKKIAIVSPELHGRPHLDFWSFLKRGVGHMGDAIAICTDYPLDAERFFNEKN